MAALRAIGLNPKPVAKWRGRSTTADAPMGPPTARFGDVISLVHAAILRPATHALNGDMSPQRHLATPAIQRALGNCLWRLGFSRWR
jgi:hypothetical protein